MRNELLDVTTVLSANTCHQRNYVETYSRYKVFVMYDVPTMREASFRANLWTSFLECMYAVAMAMHRDCAGGLSALLKC